MKAVIIIPARLSATRLPGKPLKLLGEKSLVIRVWEQALKVKGVHDVFVATDSPEIQVVVEQAGGKVVMTRSDHLSGSDRVAEAAQKIDADFILNLQGDEPFVDPEDLARIAAKLRACPDHIVTLDYPILERDSFCDPNVVKVVKSADGRAMYFSRAPVPYSRQQPNGVEGAFAHIGVYGYRRDVLLALTQAPATQLETREGLEQLRALSLGMTIQVLPASGPARGIDSPEDLAWARERVARLGAGAF